MRDALLLSGVLLAIVLLTQVGRQVRPRQDRAAIGPRGLRRLGRSAGNGPSPSRTSPARSPEPRSAPGSGSDLKSKFRPPVLDGQTAATVHP